MKAIALTLSSLAIFCSCLYFYPDYAKTYTEVIRLNTDTHSIGFPKNFRKLSSDCSASAQFTEEELVRILHQFDSTNIWILDLREESHGFLNGDPISWYRYKNRINQGTSEQEIEKKENLLLKSLSERSFAILYKKRGNSPYFYRVKEVLSPEAMVKKHGAHYIRFSTTDYGYPSDTVVDRFVSFIKNLDPDAKLHFHCSAGKGRTTTFLTLYAIMKNEQSQSLAEITHTQKSIGGIDLLEEPDSKKWRYQDALARRQLIQDFYIYCKENPDFSTPWSEWRQAFLQQCQFPQ